MKMASDILRLFESDFKRGIRMRNLEQGNVIALLLLLWKSLIEGIDREWQDYPNIDLVYDDLIEPVLDMFFSTRISKKAKTRALDKYPSLGNRVLRIYEGEINFAEEENLVEIIDTGLRELPIITPEGICICAAFSVGAPNYEKSFNRKSLETLTSRLYDKYRSFAMRKVRQLNTVGTRLSTKEMGLVLFFIYNGNIGKRNALHVESEQTRNIITSCVKAFELKKKYRKGEDLLHRDLANIQWKMGYPFYNERNTYYIIESNYSGLIKKLQKEKHESTWSQELKDRWIRFRDEYDTHAPALRAMNAYSHTPARRRQLELKIITFDEEKGKG